MLSAGLATIASCSYDLKKVVHGKETMNILCIGHGGGSLPLFLASEIKGERLSLTLEYWSGEFNNNIISIYHNILFFKIYEKHFFFLFLSSNHFLVEQVVAICFIS